MKEKELCESFGLNAKFLPNPKKNFDELVGEPGNLRDNAELGFIIFPAKQIFEKYPIKLKNSPLNENPPWGRMTLEIDFTKVNSFKNLKTEVEGWLNEFHAEYLRTSKNEGKERKQRYNINYGRILTVGKLKEKDKMTNQQIAAIIFPHEVGSISHESAIRKVSHLYKSYKDLVNGGYKDINII